MAKLLVARRGNSLRVEAVSDPADANVYESGALVPAQTRGVGGPNFEEWPDAVRP